MAKWLDKDGASYLYGKIKSNFASKSDAIKNITRSGTTFTATKADGTTFTFTQQDNNTNTTYTLTQDSNDGHKITLTPSSGSATTITIPDNNTTYSSKAAASGGTDVSLVTTGEKYIWNNKSNLTIGTTATTAAAGNHTHDNYISKIQYINLITDSPANRLVGWTGNGYEPIVSGTSFDVSHPIYYIPSETSASEKTIAYRLYDNVSSGATGIGYALNYSKIRMYLAGTFNGILFTIATNGHRDRLDDNTYYIAVGDKRSVSANIYDFDPEQCVYKYENNELKCVWPVDTWRGIQDNLTSSTNTTESLSAKQGYLLANGSARDNTKLPLSGGTMTGVLTVKGSMYDDSYSGALNMNNSNIYGLNSIYTCDVADGAAEGIHFYRDASHVDTFWMAGGNMYFVPNRAIGTNTTAANSYKVYHTGNKPTYSDVGAAATSHTHGAADITSGTLNVARFPTSGVTAGNYGDSSAQTPGYGSTFKVPYITVDTYGRITSISEHTVKIPASDNTNTLNTAGSTDTSSKIFLIGATSQAANPQTYSDNEVYATSGTLRSTKFNVADHVTQQYNTTTQALDFIFS